MTIQFTVNGKKHKVAVEGSETLRAMLVRLGYTNVRDSDDGDGFAGSDTIIFNDLPVYANLMNAVRRTGRSHRRSVGNSWNPSNGDDRCGSRPERL